MTSIKKAADYLVTMDTINGYLKEAHQEIKQYYHEASQAGIMTAEISPCGQYRYVLTRKTKCPLRWNKTALFIMLNPSTADAFQDDPTIRRCTAFAERECCTNLTVVNLFALRATNPKELLKHPDPVGPLNDQFLANEIQKVTMTGGIVIAAWGANKFAQKRAFSVTSYLNYGNIFTRLGKNKDGSPKHPLYVKGDSPLIKL